MKLLAFNNSFPDERACRLHWKKQREVQGIVCKCCGGIVHEWKEKQQIWDCSGCHFRTSLRSGTIMESSKLAFRDWYIAMHFLTSTKHAFSAKELQRELGRKRYEPVWAMLHKLRYSMGKRDDNYELENFVEFDDAFFSTFEHNTKEEKKTKESNQHTPLKRGKGSQKKSKVMVMAESAPSTLKEQEAGNYSKPRKLGHIRMIVVEDLKKETINTLVEKKIDKNTIVRTDGSNSFVDIKTKVKEHEFEVMRTGADVNKFLPWVHILAFGEGFLKNPKNVDLLQAVQNGNLKAPEYYRLLLRLVYRLLFLMVIEERNLVYPSNNEPAIRRLRDIYYRYYSLGRLRALTRNNYSKDSRYTDLGQGLQNTFRLYENEQYGNPLDVKPLNGELFGSNALSWLETSSLDNKTLLNALENLSWFTATNGSMQPITTNC